MQHQSKEVLEPLKELLVKLSNESPILGAALFSVEGLPLVSHIQSGVEEVSIAAIVGGIQSAGEMAVTELKQGELKSIIVQGTLGTTLVISIPGDYLLTVTAPDNAKLGLIFNDAKKAGRKAARILKGIL